MGKLEGQIAVVTGGNSGIGRAAAEALVVEGARGASIILNASIVASKGRKSPGGMGCKGAVFCRETFSQLAGGSRIFDDFSHRLGVRDHYDM